MASGRLTILKAFGLYVFSQGKAIPIPINDNRDEAATQSQENNLQIHALRNINLEFVLWN
jgi:hypothetical protein